MKERTRPRTRTWIRPVGIASLIASPIILYYFLSQTGLSATVVAGVTLVLLLKHLGLLAVLLGPVYAMLRRRFRH